MGGGGTFRLMGFTCGEDARSASVERGKMDGAVRGAGHVMEWVVDPRQRS